MSIDETIPMRLRRVYLTIHRAAQSHFSPFGVTVDQYVLLSVLAEADGMIQSELSGRMSSDANTVGAMLKLLEQKELIRREPCELDRRAQRVYLTAKGKQLQKKLIRHAGQIHQALDDALGPKKRQLLLDCLELVSNTAFPGETDHQ